MKELNVKRFTTKRLDSRTVTLENFNDKKNHDCECCNWYDSNKKYYLIPVAEGGKDVLDNVVYLCPVHHSLASRNALVVERDEHFLMFFDRTWGEI